MILNVNDWHMSTQTHDWLCPGSMALYCAEKPLPAMLPSEWKVTHTVLLFVLTVGGATLPQNLQEGRTDLWMISFYLNRAFFVLSHFTHLELVESELCPVDSFKDMWLSYVTVLVFHFVATFQECEKENSWGFKCYIFFPHEAWKCPRIMHRPLVPSTNSSSNYMSPDNGPLERAQYTLFTVFSSLAHSFDLRVCIWQKIHTLVAPM